jgi:hypothetical protein
MHQPINVDPEEVNRRRARPSLRYESIERPVGEVDRRTVAMAIGCLVLGVAVLAVAVVSAWGRL